MEADFKSYYPILVKKSYEQQKCDLLEIFEYDKSINCSQVHERWQFAFDLIDPIGWNAIWKISREWCSKLNLSFPAIAVIEVQDLDCKRFLASVKVIDLVFEDGLTISEIVTDVPLMQLFPTLEQNYDVININYTASLLHDLRVFFTHLWYEWDENFTKNDDSLLVRFEDRLQLYYDILCSQIDPKICSTIQLLLEEAKEINERIIDLEEQLSSANCEDLSELVTKSDKKYLLWSKLNLELNCITKHLNFYEKKSFRDSIVNEEDEQGKRICGERIVSLAHSNFGSSADFSSAVKEITNHLSVMSNTKMCFKSSNCLDDLLSPWQHLYPNGKLFLKKGTYSLRSRLNINVIEGVVQGLDNKCDIVVSDADEGFYLLNIRSNQIEMSNMFFKSANVTHVLIVHSSKCYLKNLTFSNDNKVKIAIVADAGAQLVIDNCHFSNFMSAAIRASKDSSIVLKNSIFDNSMNGVEFKEGCTLSIDNCQFINHKGFALLMETSDSLKFPLEKGKDVLKDCVPGLNIVNSTFRGNRTDLAKYC